MNTQQPPRRDGNVRGDDGERRPPPTDFRPGDIVAMLPGALRMPHLSAMCPRQLYQMGADNEFLVLETFETPEDGPCLALWPCCRVLDRESGKLVNKGFLDRKRNTYRCNGHPAPYFEKVDFVRLPKKGDRSSSIFMPWLGEVAAIDYQEDEDNPRISMRLFGAEGGGTGFWATLLKNIAEAGRLM